MTLDNLIGKSLERITIAHDTIKRLIAAAERNIADAMRKQRNVVDYSGDIVPESAVKDCIIQAESLLMHFNAFYASKTK